MTDSPFYMRYDHQSRRVISTGVIKDRGRYGEVAQSTQYELDRLELGFGAANGLWIESRIRPGHKFR